MVTNTSLLLQGIGYKSVNIFTVKTVPTQTFQREFDNLHM